MDVIVNDGQLRGLIIRPEFLASILEGKKSIEMRKKPTKRRGRILLIEPALISGIQFIVGECVLIACNGPLELDKKAVRDWVGDLAAIDYEKHPELLENKYAWALENVRALKSPLKFGAIRGPQTWMKIPRDLRCRYNIEMAKGTLEVL